MKLSKVLFKIINNTAVITLNNPKILNAWDNEMRETICGFISNCKKK